MENSILFFNFDGLSYQDLKPIISSSNGCKAAKADENNVISGEKYKKPFSKIEGAYSEATTAKEKQDRHNSGWSNMFALPWEVSAYWNFTTR